MLALVSERRRTALQSNTISSATRTAPATLPNTIPTITPELKQLEVTSTVTDMLAESYMGFTESTRVQGSDEEATTTSKRPVRGSELCATKTVCDPPVTTTCKVPPNAALPVTKTADPLDPDVAYTIVDEEGFRDKLPSTTKGRADTSVKVKFTVTLAATTQDDIEHEQSLKAEHGFKAGREAPGVAPVVAVGTLVETGTDGTTVKRGNVEVIDALVVVAIVVEVVVGAVFNNTRVVLRFAPVATMLSRPFPKSATSIQYGHSEPVGIPNTGV